MRTLGIAVAVLLALVAAAVAVAPRLIDWNRYRPEIAAHIETALGRRVEINGDLSLRLVPSPALAVEGVRLANAPGAAEPYMIAVEAVRLQLAPAALLGGTIRIRSLTLVQPTIHLQTFPDGRGNWEFRSLAAPPAGSLPPESRPSDGGGVDLQIENLVVENGTVLFQRPDSEAVRLDSVDATVSAGGTGGPFQAQGDATWAGVQGEYEISAGRVAGAGTVPLSATLRLPDKRAEAKLTGQMMLADAPKLRAKLAVSAGNLAEILAMMPRPGAPAPGLGKPVAVEGMIEASAGQIDVNDMAVRLGDTEGKGALGVKWGGQPAIDLALVFNRIDLDALIAVDRPAAAPTAGGSPAELPAGDGVPFTLPGNLAMRADLAAEVVLYRGSIVRQAKFEAGLDRGVLSVRRASALLPGGSDISVAGTLRETDRRLAVDGSIEASSDNLRAVLEWLGVAAAKVPADRLRKFSGDGKLRGSLDDLVVSDLDLRLDTSRLRGAANMRLAGRPAIGANLVIDNVNVDAYLPAPERTDAGAGEAVPMSAPAAVPAAANTAVLDTFDANLKLRIESLTLNDVSVRDLLLDGSLVGGDLTLRQVTVGDFGGALARLEGAIGGLAAGPAVVRGLSYDVRTLQPAKMLRLLGVQPGFDAGRLGAIAVQGRADGPLTELRLSGRIDLAGGEVSAEGMIDAGGTVPAFAFDVTAGHPNVVELIRNFLPDYRPAGRLGKGAVAAKLQGRGLTASAEDLHLAVGSVEVSGTMSIDLSGKPALTARLDVGDMVVDDFLPAPRAAFLQRSPSDWLVTPMTPQPVATRVGPLPGGSPIPAAATGTPPWSREPLDLAWLGAVSADAALTARSVTYGRQRLEGVQAAVKVADDTAVLEALTATLFGGALTMDARLARDGSAAGKLAIANARLRQALAASAGIDVAAGQLTGNASFTTRGASPFDMASNLAGSGEVAVRDGVVRGFDLAEVSRRLDSIENVGSLLGLLQAGMGGGQTRFSSLTATFIADHGNVVSRDIALQAEAGQGQGTATVNLPAYSLDARLLFALAAHPGMPPFALRLDGPLDNPRRVFEANELQAWLVSKGMGRLLEGQGGEAGKVIDRLLGGGQTSQSAPAQPAPSPKPGVEDVLRGLLKELGR